MRFWARRARRRKPWWKTAPLKRPMKRSMTHPIGTLDFRFVMDFLAEFFGGNFFGCICCSYCRKKESLRRDLVEKLGENIPFSARFSVRFSVRFSANNFLPRNRRTEGTRTNRKPNSSCYVRVVAKLQGEQHICFLLKETAKILCAISSEYFMRAGVLYS